MNSEGWRPLRRQKKPLLTAKKRAARLKFALQHTKLTAEEWDDFLFKDKCPKYLFQLPNPKNDIVWGSQESGEPSSSSISVQNGSYGAEWQAAVSLGYIFYPKDRLWVPITTSTTYKRKRWSLSFTVKMWMKQQTKKIVQFQSPHDVRPRRGASTRSQGHPGMVQKKTCQIL